MSGPLRVGIVGATPARGWGTLAHLPALAALPEFAVTAVATTRPETARATADAFGVPLAFDNAAGLIASPDVDVVAITVKVTQHELLVRAALTAGKHVFCEWPLGTGLAQASELAELAAASGRQHVVGLQGYYSPGARYVAKLIGQGAIGRLLAVSAVAVGRQGGGRIQAPAPMRPTGPRARPCSASPPPICWRRWARRSACRGRSPRWSLRSTRLPP